MTALPGPTALPEPTTLPGLLLLHGAGDSGECWGPFVARLRREPGMSDLEVMTPDAPAHGGRPAEPGASIEWTDLLADAVRNAEDLATRTGGPIVVAGHSMGAMTALGVAAHRPDLVAATLLEDPPLQAPLSPPGAPPTAPTPVDVTPFREWFAELQATPFDRVVAGARTEHPTWDDGEYEPWARSKQSVDLRAFAQPVVFVHAETDLIVRQAHPPIVLVAGEPDRGSMLAPAAADDLSSLPGWTVHRVPGTGHDVRRDAPEVTVRLLADLIRSVAGQSRTTPVTTPAGT